MSSHSRPEASVYVILGFTDELTCRVVAESEPLSIYRAVTPDLRPLQLLRLLV